MIPLDRHRDIITAQHGNQAGIDALGYPTSWITTRAELEQVTTQLTKGETTNVR